MKDKAAFPVATSDIVHHYGMTLRDWFAGQALAGFGPTYFHNPSVAAKLAYAAADAMLAERKESTTP